jgi:phosphatidylserine/phosphatidylglycerophosphate/cardiolipin synthase-like enzyme
MSKVTARSYLSPTMVLLAMDWDEGFNTPDFLGFAIKRTPGFSPGAGQPQTPFSWLPNRIGFNGANPGGGDMPSNENPLQHFHWFDARINDNDRGKTFTYDIFPVTGSFNNLNLVKAKSATIKCLIPQVVVNGIGTYFNRAVVSSQAFSKQFGVITTHAQYVQALEWLSNGMDNALTNFINAAEGKGLAIVTYHLTDTQWSIPALQNFKAKANVVYFLKEEASGGDTTNLKTVDTLSANKNITFFPRTKTAIMHDKFMVRTKSSNQDEAEAVLTGTANFTIEGLTQQANVIHTFESPELARLYMQRHLLLRKDPSVSDTATGAAWSAKIKMQGATIRVFFPPEKPAPTHSNPTGSRVSIDTIVNNVKAAKSSVFFSLFSVTDAALLDACLSVAQNGKLMRGLVNEISEPKPGAKENASTVAATWLYDRSKEDNMVVGHDSFRKGNVPNGFWFENNILKDPTAPASNVSSKKFIPNVYVHQKIVIIDGESNSPVIYVGSANLSGNSTWHNDENLLEITECKGLASAYVAEFIRLYETYRARFAWNKSHSADGTDTGGFSLTKDSGWAAKDYKPGTMEYLARQTLS